MVYNSAPSKTDFLPHYDKNSISIKDSISSPFLQYITGLRLLGDKRDRKAAKLA